MCVSLATALSNVSDKKPKELYQESCSRWCSIQWDGKEMSTLNGMAWQVYVKALICGEAPPSLQSLGDVARSGKEADWKANENFGDTGRKVVGTLLVGGAGVQLMGRYNQSTKAGLESRQLLIWGLIDAIGKERFALLPRHDLTKLKPRAYPAPEPLAVGYIKKNQAVQVVILVRVEDSKGKPQTLTLAPHPTSFAWEGKATPPGTAAFMKGILLQSIEPDSTNYPKLIALIQAAADKAFPQQS